MEVEEASEEVSDHILNSDFISFDDDDGAAAASAAAPTSTPNTPLFKPKVRWRAWATHSRTSLPMACSSSSITLRLARAPLSSRSCS